MRLTVAFFVLVLAVAAPGCAGLRGASVHTAAQAAGARGVVTFEAELSGPRSPDSTVKAPSGRMTITFRDAEHFEYDIVVRDAGEVTYVAAWVVPIGRSEPVAVVVSDVSLGGNYAQLRGTGVTGATMAGPNLLERLRIRPGDYEVWVPSLSGGGVLAGVLGVR